MSSLAHLFLTISNMDGWGGLHLPTTKIDPPFMQPPHGSSPLFSFSAKKLLEYYLLNLCLIQITKSPRPVKLQNPCKKISSPLCGGIWVDSSVCSLANGVLATIFSSCFPPPKGRFLRVTHLSATENIISYVRHSWCIRELPI